VGPEAALTISEQPVRAGKAESKAPGPYGKSSLYNGRSGQWAFVLHRITGFLVFMFLLLHVVDVSLINYRGGRLYNEVHQVYGNIFLRLFEVGLLFALLYHALNGLRIVMIDFFPGAVKNQKNLWSAVLALSVLGTVIGGVIIVKPFFTGS
jgi:succinate dehydrogenase / fumarate reductase cytochrome b subunit